MTKKQDLRRFDTGHSHYRYEVEWIEEKVIEAIVTDTNLAIDIDAQGEDGHKERVTIQAASVNNGDNYSGAYTYARNTYPRGKVELKRYKSSQGYMFSGLWISDDGDSDIWIIELESLEV